MTIGNALDELSSFVSNASGSLNNYADKFSNFNSENNTYALNYSNHSKNELVSLVKNNYQTEINSAKSLVDNYMELDSRFSKLSINDNMKYASYVRQLQTLNNNFENGFNSNLIESLEALNDLKDNVENFPTDSYKNYVKSIAERIKSEQIISTPEESEFLSAFTNIKDYKANSYKDTKILSASLFSLYDNVKSNNWIFYVTLIITLVGGTLLGFIIIKKRKI
ncbi:MAG: hypothetical protein Q8N03_17365 [Ignavibacteria bacterium]|nr:hypothetical protein [Ignavibacteria bacterium]